MEYFRRNPPSKEQGGSELGSRGLHKTSYLSCAVELSREVSLAQLPEVWEVLHHDVRQVLHIQHFLRGAIAPTTFSTQPSKNNKNRSIKSWKQKHVHV